jgi:hypothetical protein
MRKSAPTVPFKGRPRPAVVLCAAGPLSSPEVNPCEI